MNNSFTNYSVYFLLIAGLFSCVEDELQRENITEESSLTQKKNDTIVELDSLDFPEVKEHKENLANASVYDNLYQLEGFTFFVQPKVSYLGNNTLQTNGLGQEITLNPYNSGNSFQLFYLEFLPSSTGIPYLIRSFDLGEVIGAGSYASDPDNYVLYTRSSGSSSLFGFAWDFYLNDEQDGYIIENRDIIGVGPGGPFDIFYYALHSQNGEISFVRRNNSSVYQQFNIIPNDEFTIQSVELDFNNSIITSTSPYFLRNGSISNSSSSVITQNLTLTESESEQSSFRETNGITTNKTGNLSLGVTLFEVVEIGGGYSVEAGTSQTIEYGSTSNRTITVEESFSIPVPPQTIVNYQFIAIRHRIDIAYNAELSGVNTGNSFEVSGMYSGVAYSSTYLEVTETPIGGRTGEQRTYRIYPDSN